MIKFKVKGYLHFCKLHLPASSPHPTDGMLPEDAPAKADSHQAYRILAVIIRKQPRPENFKTEHKRLFFIEF